MFAFAGSNASPFTGRAGRFSPGSRFVHVLPSRVSCTCPPRVPYRYVLQELSESRNSISRTVPGFGCIGSEFAGELGTQDGAGELKKLSVRQTRLVPVKNTSTFAGHF